MIEALSHTITLEGKIPCGGFLRLDGAKNSALRLMAASILTSGAISLNRFPSTQGDVTVQWAMLENIGKTIAAETDRIVIRENSELNTTSHWNDRSIRNTLLMLGALTARFGVGRVPLPGGCNLGERKYDLHEMVLRAMGAEVWVEKGAYLCAEAKGRLKGAEIHLPIRSTGATENGILCGVLAEGRTVIWHPHIRPEIMDLIAMLRKMGASIAVFGQERIEIQGVEGLTGAEHEVIPDNMEALTWAVAAVVTGGDIEISPFPYEHLEVPMVFLRESGMKYYRGEDSLIVRGGTPYPLEISTGPYPGINSDMQPIMAVFAACARGESRIIDLRFPGRYQYAEELRKMGLCYQVDGNMLVIDGGKPFTGAEVNAVDLRAGAALVLAGLVAEGETVIHNAWQIDRGYCDLPGKLQSLGATVRVNVSDANPTETRPADKGALQNDSGLHDAIP